MNLLVATLWTASEMTAEQQQVLASAQGTDGGVKACASIDAATRSEWDAFLAPLVAFCNTPVANFVPTGDEVLVTGTRADQLRNYEAELKAWQQKLSGFPGCSFSPPLANTQSGFDSATLMSALKWGVVGAGVIASAVVVSKVAETVQLFGPRRAA